MIKKFRKRPVVIEATQFTGTKQSIVEIKNWSEGAIDSYTIQPDERVTDVLIRTLEGNMHVSRGDWVIKGVNGEFYPCKPDIFEKTYEEALV